MYSFPLSLPPSYYYISMCKVEYRSFPLSLSVFSFIYFIYFCWQPKEILHPLTATMPRREKKEKTYLFSTITFIVIIIITLFIYLVLKRTIAERVRKRHNSDDDNIKKSTNNVLTNIKLSK